MNAWWPRPTEDSHSIASLTPALPECLQISLSQTALARTAAVSSKKGRTSQIVRAETTDLAKVRF